MNYRQIPVWGAHRNHPSSAFLLQGFVRQTSPPKAPHYGGAPEEGPGSENDVVIDGMRVLGRKYEVQHVVGEGAYGLVMKCQVIGGSGKHVAIKSFKIEVRGKSIFEFMQCLVSS